MALKTWPRLRHLRVMGLLSIGAALLALAADEILQYTPQGYATLAFTQNLPLWRMFTGHLLGVLAIPLCLTGYWCVCQGLKLGGARYTGVLFWLIAYGLVMGAIAHDSISVYFVLLRDGASPTLTPALSYVQTYANIPGALFLLCYAATSIWYSAAIVSRRALYPLWMAFCSPFMFSLLIGLLHAINALPVVMNVLWPAWLSAAHVIFFILSTLVLWRTQAPESQTGNFPQFQEKVSQTS